MKCLTKDFFGLSALAFVVTLIATTLSYILPEPTCPGGDIICPALIIQDRLALLSGFTSWLLLLANIVVFAIFLFTSLRNRKKQKEPTIYVHWAEALLLANILVNALLHL